MKQRAVLESQVDDVTNALLNEIHISEEGKIYIGQTDGTLKKINTDSDMNIIDENHVQVRFISPIPDKNGGYLLKTLIVKKGTDITSGMFPQHVYNQYLTPDGWTHDLTELTDLQHDIDVGAMYKSVDGVTRAFITLNAVTGLAPTLYWMITGTATFRIEWGDGMFDDVSATGNISHTYSGYGNYIIKISRIDGTGTISLGGGTTSTAFVGGLSTSAYIDALVDIIVGDYTLLGGYAFSDNHRLRTVVLPKNSTIGSGVFNKCYNLISCVLPNTQTAIPSFAYSYNLLYIVLPNSITNLGNHTFSYCYGLNRNSA